MTQRLVELEGEKIQERLRGGKQFAAEAESINDYDVDERDD